MPGSLEPGRLCLAVSVPPGFHMALGTHPPGGRERSKHLRGHDRVESVATKGLLPGPPQTQLLPGLLVAGRNPD